MGAVTSPVLNVKEAAEYIGVSRSQLYTLMDAGEIPVVRVSTARRVLLIEDLNAYLESKRSSKATA